MIEIRTTTHCPYQCNAWLELSSWCSTCYRVLPLLPRLRVRTSQESARARKRTRCFSDHSKNDCDTLPLPVRCLVWAVGQLLDVILCVAIAPSPESEDE